MQVAISTTDREPAFVHDLLKTLLKGGQADDLRIRCVVCGPDDTYLDRWSKHVDTETLDKRGLRKINHLKPKRRIFFNAIRCLSGADHADSLLICQDDVVFCSDWRSKLAKMVATAPEYLGKSQPRHRELGRNSSRYILSLYAAYPFKTRPVCGYPIQKFYGTQCMYFPQEVLGEVAKAMDRAFDSGRCPPDDIWLKEWCTRQDLPILCGIPNLVQHIGRGSTIGSPFHESPTFEG
jgi:hypothetical protein